MNPVVRARSFVASRHLGEMLSPYADRSLGVATLLVCDRHVSICPGCRAAVDAERRMLRSLRTAAMPGLSSRFASTLLDVGEETGPLVCATAHSPLALVDRSAPALYRSAARAAMLAGLVAGASAAAAWSLGVSGLGPSGGALPVVQLPASSAAVASTTGYPPGSQAASFLSTNGLAGVAGSTGLTATFTAASTQTVSVPVAPPWTGVSELSPGSALWTHE